MYRSYLSYMLVIVVVLALNACSNEEIKRFGYQLGAQHTCMEANRGHAYESVKDLECTGNAHVAELSYEEYDDARRQALGQERATKAQ